MFEELTQTCSNKECDAYGSLYCRICTLYYCNDHKCSHLPDFDISFENLDKDLELDADLESEVSSSNYILSAETSFLRKRRDSLFKELKNIQKELDSRSIHSLEFNPNSINRIRSVSSRPRSTITTKQARSKAELKNALDILQKRGILENVLKMIRGSK
jgi:hypothetical protein